MKKHMLDMAEVVAILPRRIFTENITSSAKWTYLCLSVYPEDRDRTISAISRIMGADRKTIRSAVHALEFHGYIGKDLVPIIGRESPWKSRE